MMSHDSPFSFAQHHRQADRIRLSNAAAARVVRLREQAETAERKDSAKSTARNEKRPV